MFQPPDRSRRIACLLLTAAGFLPAPSGRAEQQPPQTEPPVFRSGVQVIEVDVRVFDRDGRFITDLSREDFEVRENDVAQQLQTLYLVGEPSGAAALIPAPGAAAAAEAQDRGAPSPASTRQTWIFVFDLNHLAPGSGFDRARAAVTEFIRERFKDGDLAGVVAGSRMVNNRLTSVREELVGAAQSVKPLADSRNRQIELTRGWPRLRDEEEALRIAREDREALGRAVTRACTDDPDACVRVPPDLQIREKARRFQRDMQRAARETLAAINGLASGLARVPGPKTVVFLSEGFVTEEMETTLRTVVGQAARAGARIYAVDVRGLNRGRGAGIIDQEQADDPVGGPAQFDLGEDGPNSLAIDTGGLLIRNENNIGRALDRIARDSGQYYVLGYQPTDANFDGKFRPIDVRVKRAGVRVRARRGYLALEPSKLLVPQLIKAPMVGSQAPAGPGLDFPSAEPTPGAGTDATEPHVPTAAIDAGVPAPAPAVAGTIRLRPDAGRRIAALSEGETIPAAELATEGWEAYQRGDIETAFAAFTRAATDPGVRPWVLYALGLSQAGLGRPLDAVASWERVRQAAPEFEPVYIDLADTYLQLSELTRALGVLRDAEQRWPSDPGIHNGIGVIHVRRGALDEAIAAFSAAAESAPPEPLAYLNLARAYELRYMRGRRYVSSQRRWIAPEDDRRKAMESYRRCVQLGGPYAQPAAEAIARLEWSKD